MRRYLRNANAWRQISVAAPAAAGLLLLLGLAVVFYTEEFYRKARLGELTVQAQTLAATVTAALAFNDRDAAREYVGALEADPWLQAAAIYSPNGSLFAGYRRPDALPLPKLLRPGDRPVEPGRVLVTVPVTQNGVLLGTVYLRTMSEPFLLLVQRYSAIFLLAVMAALVVGVLGIGQAALARANRELNARASDLAAANAQLGQQIAERERVEEALRQTQKMEAIGQLTGGIAHDFNNLLQVILGSLDLIKRQLGPDDRVIARHVEGARLGGERAATLTAQLLAFARRQPLAPRATDVNKLVAGMSGLLHRTLGESIEIETVLAARLWWASADTNQLENALLNLAVNARDAMPGGGKLTIETQNAYLDETYGEPNEEHPVGQCVMIAISDTGSGMSKAVVAKAFEPFFTTKDVGHGTGLGLSQVYGFVKQSGGHVKIYSELGEGTTIKIYLPRSADLSPQPEAVSIPGEAPRSTGQELVLVVEDDDTVRATSVEMLRNLGYNVIAVEDGHAALRALDREPEFDLLFTDVGLPGGLNGRQLADEARRRRPDLRVLFATGYARNAITHHGRLDPGIELILKPYSYIALAKKIREVLHPEA